MTINQKTTLLHKIHIYSSLYINVLIRLIVRAIHHSIYDVKLLFVISAILVLEILGAVNRASLDVDLKDMAIVCRYLLVLMISCFIIYETYIDTSFKLAMIPAIAIIIEILIVFLITYRYKIRNKIRTFLKRKKTK